MCVCPTVKPTSVATLFVQDAGDIPFGDKVGHSPWVPAEVAGPPDGTVLVVLHCSTSHAMPSRRGFFFSLALLAAARAHGKESSSVGRYTQQEEEAE